MYKNQLQELAQRSCFNLPSYTCIREGPDHAPRFKASVNFNGEVFEGPCNCTTLRQAEHSAAEVALNTLSIRGPSRSVTAKVIDETGVYKNLLQETAHRAGLNLPTYTTVRSGPGHVPVFSSTVEVAGMPFKGETAKTKKQAEKNAALAAWSALKQMPNLSFSSSSLTNKETTDSNNEEQERVVVARVLSKYSPKDETKQGKQRIMNQARKGIVSGFSVNNSKCRYGSSTENSMLYQQWRSIAMSSDFHPSQYQNRVFAPLRPAAVRPTENPSLLTPNKSIPVQVKTNLQVNKQEVSVPIQEHQQEEEEWLHGKSFVNEKKKTTEKDLLNQANPKPNPNYQIYTYPQLINNPMPDPRTPTNQTHIRSIGYVPALPPLPSIRPSLTRCMAQTTFSYPRDINTFGFHHSHNMAPSVNIRSVVPVCSAPPPMMPTSLSSNASKPVRIQEVSSSPSVSATKTTVTTQHTEKEVQEASRKLSNLQL